MRAIEIALLAKASSARAGREVCAARRILAVKAN